MQVTLLLLGSAAGHVGLQCDGFTCTASSQCWQPPGYAEPWCDKGNCWTGRPNAGCAAASCGSKCHHPFPGGPQFPGQDCYEDRENRKVCGSQATTPSSFSPPPSPPSPPRPPDYTGSIVGISIGAIALILLIGVSGCIVARRTAPMRADWARKRALREPLTACGLTRHLQQAGVGDDEQVLERAAAWVTANKPASVEDLIQFGMVQGFVDSLKLPAIPKRKLLAALEGHEATPVAMGMAVDEQKELGGVRLSGSAGAAASSSTQPTLIQAAEILKRELRLEGSLKDVVQQAAAQLGIEPGPPLTELAQQCLRELHPGMTQEV